MFTLTTFASILIVGFLGFVALLLHRQFRLRRHLHRLRTVPMERFYR